MDLLEIQKAFMDYRIGLIWSNYERLVSQNYAKKRKRHLELINGGGDKKSQKVRDFRNSNNYF